MVEGIEEIGGKANVKTLFEPKVLVDRQVVVPRARPDHVIARIGVVKSTERGVEARSIAQSAGKLPDELSGAIRTCWPNRRGNDSAADSRYRSGVEIAGEPLTEWFAGADDVQSGAFVGRDADITRLDESRIHAHPEATIPSANSGHLPASYQIVERRGNVPAKVLASSEGKLVDGVESDPVRRD